MWLPQAVSTMREYKILKRLRVTPVSPVFILGVELTMYIVYCSVSLAVLAVPAALFWHVRLRGSLLRFLGSRARCLALPRFAQCFPSVSSAGNKQ